MISLFLRLILGGAVDLDASCGAVLSRKTLKLGGDALEDSLSGPFGDCSDGAGWYIQGSAILGDPVRHQRADFTAVAVPGLMLAA